MRMHSLFVIFSTLLFLLTQGCAGGTHYAMAEAAPPEPEMASAPEAPSGEGYGYAFDGAPKGPEPSRLAFQDAKPKRSRPGDDNAGPAPEGQTASDGVTAEAEKAPTGPLLVYSANLVLSVFEAKSGLSNVETLAKQKHGYLVTRNDSSITIRVPAEVFEETLKEASTLGDELHREVKVSDVTSEFRDLEIRLQNARAVRTRLEELLAKAKDVTEALQVEKEMERVAGEIEMITGKLKLFRELISFSTITVVFSAKPSDRVNTQVTLPFPWLNELGLGNLLSL